jgi:hypothetical protein
MLREYMLRSLRVCLLIYRCRALNRDGS